LPLRLRKALGGLLAAYLTRQIVEPCRNAGRDLPLRRLDHRRPADDAGPVGRRHAEIRRAVPHDELGSQTEVARAVTANGKATLAEVGDNQLAGRPREWLIVMIAGLVGDVGNRYRGCGDS